MTAKQYLQSYQTIHRNYQAIAEHLKSIDIEMISIKSPSFDDRVQTSPVKDPIGEQVIRLEQKKGRLGVELTSYGIKLTLIENQIKEMAEINNDYYVILFFRYVLSKDWQFICDRLHISRSHANVLHGHALLEFDKKFGNIFAEK